MTQFDMDALVDLKLLILKDLEKTLKMVYEHKYRNILTRIVSNRRRFTKKSLPVDTAENICRYNTLSLSLVGYLSNLFDVFGESAVLNAKKAFEENGSKWGKKLRKKLSPQGGISDFNNYIKALYIDVPEADFLRIQDNRLEWHLESGGPGSAGESFRKFQTGFYDIKAAWLVSFIKSLSPQYSISFEKGSGEEIAVITNIELKEIDGQNR
ncbi:MAG: hypothetical protein ACM3ZR_09645 [Pseudomonadota bacterium]